MIVGNVVPNHPRLRVCELLCEKGLTQDSACWGWNCLTTHGMDMVQPYTRRDTMYRSHPPSLTDSASQWCQLRRTRERRRSAAVFNRLPRPARRRRRATAEPSVGLSSQELAATALRVCVHVLLGPPTHPGMCESVDACACPLAMRATARPAQPPSLSGRACVPAGGSMHDMTWFV